MTFPDRLRKPGYRYVGALVFIGIILTAPRWTHAALHRLSYFHVRKLEIRGTRYLQPEDVVARLRIDTLRSIVDDLSPLEQRLRSHPQVADVNISRRFPGTLVITIRENLPVALVPQGDGLQPYDSAGRALPIDPTRIQLDLPVVMTSSPSVLQLVGALRAQSPMIYDRVSDVIPGASDLIFELTPALRVRTAPGVAAARFRDIFPVESDLARRNERAIELDIRYRDQVVARLQ